MPSSSSELHLRFTFLSCQVDSAFRSKCTFRRTPPPLNQLRPSIGQPASGTVPATGDLPTPSPIPPTPDAGFPMNLQPAADAGPIFLFLSQYIFGGEAPHTAGADFVLLQVFVLPSTKRLPLQPTSLFRRLFSFFSLLMFFPSDVGLSPYRSPEVAHCRATFPEFCPSVGSLRSPMNLLSAVSPWRSNADHFLLLNQQVVQGTCFQSPTRPRYSLITFFPSQLHSSNIRRKIFSRTFFPANAL